MKAQSYLKAELVGAEGLKTEAFGDKRLWSLGLVDICYRDCYRKIPDLLRGLGEGRESQTDVVTPQQNTVLTHEHDNLICLCDPISI